MENLEEKLRKAFKKEIEVPEKFTNAIKTALDENNIKRYKRAKWKQLLTTAAIFMTVCLAGTGLAGASFMSYHYFLQSGQQNYEIAPRI